MRSAPVLAVFAGLVLTPALAATGAGVARPRVALSVSPARVVVAAPGSRKVIVRNDGAERVALVIARTNGVATAGVQIAPRRLLLPAGKSASLTLRARLGQKTEPGEHRALVLLTAHSAHHGHVDLQLRLGVRVMVRVPGQIVRRLALGGVRVHRARRRRLVFVSVANRGNVTVEVRGRTTMSLFRRSKRVGRLRLLTPRMLPPGVRTMLTLGYSGRVHGPVTALVRVRLGAGVRPVERRYRIRL